MWKFASEIFCFRGRGSILLPPWEHSCIHISLSRLLNFQGSPHGGCRHDLHPPVATPLPLNTSTMGQPIMHLITESSIMQSKGVEKFRSQQFGWKNATGFINCVCINGFYCISYSYVTKNSTFCFAFYLKIVFIMSNRVNKSMANNAVFPTLHNIV